MTSKHNQKNNLYESVTYQIRVQSLIKPEWGSWFEDISIIHEDTGNTLLTCPQLDQSGLYGVLKKVRDSGLLLISVERIEPDKAELVKVKHI